jgi:hypothetical protein
MHWEDTPTRKAINLGAVFGIPDNPTQFRVSILRVPETDALPPALTEFWRRLLSEGVAECSDRWEVLLFQMNLLGGGFTCVFTDLKLGRDEPPVIKFSSAAWEAECDELAEESEDDAAEEAAYQGLEARCLDQLRAAAQVEPVAELFRALQGRRVFLVQVCDFNRTRQWPLGI